jgi:nitroreductase
MENLVLENMKTRRSIRAYKTDEMPSDELINAVLEAGTFAPTGMGMQSPKIVCVTNKAVRDELSALNAKFLGVTTDPFYGAPVVIAVLADRNMPTCIYDGSLVMGNMLNAAHAVGLGACWIHRAYEIFDCDEGRKLLKQWGIDDFYEGIGFCVLGYPLKAEAPKAKARKTNYITYVK